MSQSLVAFFLDRTRCFPYWATAIASGAKVEMPFATRIQVSHPLGENPTTPHSQELSCNEHDPNKLSQRPLRNHTDCPSVRKFATVSRQRHGVLSTAFSVRSGGTGGPFGAPIRRVCTNRPVLTHGFPRWVRNAQTF